MNFSSAILNYGPILPAPPLSDGTLFYLTEGATGLYVWTFLQDSSSLILGDQTGFGWKLLATTGSIDADTLDGIDSTGFQLTDVDLTALANITGLGIYVRTGTGSSETRTIVPGSTRISVSNGSGVSGNPSVDVIEANLDLNNISGVLTVAKGGTGTSTPPSSGGVVAGQAGGYTSVVGSAGQVLVSAGVSLPVWTNQSVLSVGHSSTADSATSATSAGHASTADSATSAGSASTAPWSGITSTPTTLAGYGITDALSTSTVLNDLADVSTASEATGEVLVWSGSSWSNSSNVGSLTSSGTVRANVIAIPSGNSNQDAAINISAIAPGLMLEETDQASGSRKWFVGVDSAGFEIHTNQDNYDFISTVLRLNRFGELQVSGDVYANQIFLSPATSAGVNISSIAPGLFLTETDQLSGSRSWFLGADATSITIHTRNDDLSFLASVFSVDRAGNLYTTGTIQTPNEFIAPMITLTGTTGVHIQSVIPNIYLSETDQPVDQRNWSILVDGGILQVQPKNDAGVPFGTILGLDRSGNMYTTGNISLPGNATASLHAVPKQQLDSAIASIATLASAAGITAGSDGYYTFPGGLTIQWGYRYVGNPPSGMNTAVHLFPTAFSSIPLAPIFSYRDTTSNANIIQSYDDLSTTGFTWKWRETADSIQDATLFYIVLGYRAV